MLVLSRKTGEKIRIGDNVFLTVVRIGPDKVRLGIEAPRGVTIVREELLLAARASDTTLIASCASDGTPLALGSGEGLGLPIAEPAA